MDYADAYEYTFEEAIPCKSCRAAFAELWYELDNLGRRRATDHYWQPIDAYSVRGGSHALFAPTAPVYPGAKLPKPDLYAFREACAFTGLEYRALRRGHAYRKCNSKAHDALPILGDRTPPPL